MSPPLQVSILRAAGWVNCRQQDVIDDLKERIASCANRSASDAFA